MLPNNDIATGDNNANSEPKHQPRKRFLTICPNVALPFLATLFPALRHRVATAPAVTPAQATADPAPAPAPAPAATPETPPPPQTTQPASTGVLMSVDDFGRFIRSVKDLLQGTPLLWNGFLEVIKSFVPPPTPPSASTCHAEG